MKTLSLFLSFLLVWQQPVRAQQYQEKQDVSQPQFLKNAGFENMIATWTVAAGTRSYPKTSGDKISGQGFKLAFTSINGTLLQQTYADCSDLEGKNLLAGIHIKTPSSNVEVCSQVNGADYQCVAVPSGGTKLDWVPATMVAGASSCGMRVKTTTSTTSDITVDAARLEENRGVGSVAQASVRIRARRITSAQTITTVNPTQIIWNGVGFDDGGELDAGTGTLTVRKEGRAEFSGSILLSNLTVDETYEVRIRRNGVDLCGGSVRGIGVAAAEVHISGCAFDVVIGDIITFVADSVADTSYDVFPANNTNFTYALFPAPSNVVEFPAANILGTPFPWTKTATCPAGSLLLDGSTYTGAQYSAWAAVNGSNVSEDWRAVSPRGIGSRTINGRTKTGPSARKALQEDQLQGHTHSGRIGSGANPAGFSYSGNTNTNDVPLYLGGPADDGVNGVPRSGTETRGNSMGVIWCEWYVSQASQLIRQSVVYDTVVKAEGMNGVTSIADGTYTPTVSNVSNTSARSISTIRFKREGKNVRVWGILVATCVAGSNTATEVDVSAPILPVSSALGQIGSSVIGETGLIYQDSSNFRVHWKCNSTGSVNRTFSVDYIIP